MEQFNEGGKCFCSACGRMFSSLSMFDAHQRSLDAAPWVECLDPATITKKDGTLRFRFDDGLWKSAEINQRWANR